MPLVGTLAISNRVRKPLFARSPQWRNSVPLLSVCGLSPIIRNGLTCNVFLLQAIIFIFFFNVDHHTSFVTD